MLHPRNCTSERWNPRTGPQRPIERLDDCGLCGRTFYIRTMVANTFMQEWLCECCSRPMHPARVFVASLRSLLRGGR